ncbi:MAG TPA: methyltransferase [Candidatus Bathyarchaeia archaeon]|nr:methyltransferase [Candidatus Bathyarchaeia archaeon]
MSDEVSADIPPPFRLSAMISSLWVPQAIYAAAALGIADALAAGPTRSDELAASVGAHPGALRRLLRALTILELVAERDDGRHELTPLGSCLRKDTRDSVRSWAMLWGSERTLHSWSRIVDCVRTGESVPTLEGGGSFDHFVANPEAAAEFNQSMVEHTKKLAGAIPLAYDFSGIRTIVDVGGGWGALLPAILARYPEMRGTVFDLPHCRDGANRTFAKTRLSGRCEFVAGSFFEAVQPPGADAYILKNVIHDWNDERSVAILRNCRAAMAPGSRLLLVEAVVPERTGSSDFDRMIVSADVNMLIVTGGLERTEAEFRRLLESAGLRLASVVPTVAMLSVIEAWPV